MPSAHGPVGSGHSQYAFGSIDLCAHFEACRVAGDFLRLISSYGALFVGGIIALECTCIPVPGETVLLTASAYAGMARGPNIWSVFIAGIVGAVLGNLIAFWIGRHYGYKLLWRYGGYVRLNQSRLKIGQYLFLRHGGKFVLFARFVPLLRSIAGVLAGVNCMPRIRFVNSSVAGAVLWVGVDCTAAFFLGEELSRFTAWAGIALACLIVLAAVTIGLGWKRYEKLLQRRADQALPGDLQRCR